MARRAEDAGAVGLVIVDNEAACFAGILEVPGGLGFLKGSIGFLKGIYRV